MSSRERQTFQRTDIGNLSHQDIGRFASHGYSQPLNDGPGPGIQTPISEGGGSDDSGAGVYNSSITPDMFREIKSGNPSPDDIAKGIAKVHTSADNTGFASGATRDTPNYPSSGNREGQILARANTIRKAQTQRNSAVANAQPNQQMPLQEVNARLTAMERPTLDSANQLSSGATDYGPLVNGALGGGFRKRNPR